MEPSPALAPDSGAGNGIGTNRISIMEDNMEVTAIRDTGYGYQVFIKAARINGIKLSQRTGYNVYVACDMGRKGFLKVSRFEITDETEKTQLVSRSCATASVEAACKKAIYAYCNEHRQRATPVA